jgi:triacylglycerol lipase
VRAEQLKAFVDRVTRCACKERVNLIAHSQGGLDARYLLGPLEFAHRVSSITTISSPHRGFELAERGARAEGAGLAFLEGLTGLLSWLIRGGPEQPSDLRATLSSMSLTERAAYNAAWPDPPGVPVYSYAGITNPLVGGGELCARGELPAPRRGDLTEPALLASYWLLGGLGTPNDGVVPAEACVWGRFMGCLPADHFDQVGQVLGVTDFDHLEFYLGVARRLAAEGL